MDELIKSVLNKIKKLSDLEKVYDFYININDKDDIDLIFYHLYKIKYNNKDKVFELKEKRINQNKFRKDIIKRDKKCLLSNAPPKMCQAAHIIPHCNCSADIRYNMNNGLLLEAGIHLLFDEHLWSINQDSIVIVSDKLLNDNNYCINEYLINKYHNKKLLLSKEQLENLKFHFEQFIDKNI